MTQLAGDDDSDRALAPHARGFDTFYAHWYPRLVRYAAYLEHAWAEEIAQETLARAYANYHRLNREMPGPWLRTVARNVARDLARSHARVDALPEEYEDSVTDPYPGPEDLVIVEDARQRVRTALGDVSEVDRELLARSSVDGVTMADLAAQFSASEGTVRVRLHRARRRLGKSYLARGGNLLALPGLALTRWAYKWTRTSEAAAGPAIAAFAMAGAAVVAVGGGGLFSPTPATHQPTTTRAIAVTPTAATSAAVHRRAPSAQGRTSHIAHTAVIAYKPTAGPSTARPARVAFSVGNPMDPNGPSNKGEIAVPTPLGTYYFDTQGSRSGDPSPICFARMSWCIRQPDPQLH